MSSYDRQPRPRKTFRQVWRESPPAGRVTIGLIIAGAALVLLLCCGSLLGDLAGRLVSAWDWAA